MGFTFMVDTLRCGFFRTLRVMIYSPEGLMRYNYSVAIVDDIPLLSQWIKKSTCFHKSIFWWEMVDSNHRSEAQQIYSLPPLATREISLIKLKWSWWTDAAFHTKVCRARDTVASHFAVKNITL